MSGKGGRTSKSQNSQDNFSLYVPVGEHGAGGAGKETAQGSALKISQSRQEWNESILQRVVPYNKSLKMPSTEQGLIPVRWLDYCDTMYPHTQPPRHPMSFYIQSSRPRVFHLEYCSLC